MTTTQTETHRGRGRPWLPPYRAVVGRAVHGAPPSVVRAAVVLSRARGANALQPFGVHRRASGRPPVNLLDGYRDSVKGTWRASWWPIGVAYGLRARAELPAEVVRMLEAVEAARTLPFPVSEAAEVVAAIADDYPEDLRVTDRFDPRAGAFVVEVVPRDAEHAGTAAAYRNAAAGVARGLRRHGLQLERSELLEVGPGLGAVAYVLAEEGAASIVGVDPEAGLHARTLDQQRMLAHLVGDRAAAVRFEEGDVQTLPFPDASFDGIYSTATLEHVRDVAAALAEMRRVLRPGGIAFHGIDSWFGPRGGHGLCTLDFPWGHVRLDADELEDYVRTWRPHEADDAVVFRRTALQDPPLGIRDLEAAARSTGFEVLELEPVALPVSNAHWSYLDRTVFADCRRRYPRVTRTDLLSLGQRIALRRR